MYNDKRIILLFLLMLNSVRSFDGNFSENNNFVISKPEDFQTMARDVR